jgi:DNA-binding transcriptional MerR regulator
MTIGDFSRATRLSARTLRFYHQVGLLAPARVDPANGYRLYDAGQIADAQVIRHFRALDMPIEEIREVLSAPRVADRHGVISAHLARMEAQLAMTRSAVASLRGLLEPPTTPVEIHYRSVPATPALVIRQTIDLADLSDWYGTARGELGATGSPHGGLWSTELFLHERGEAALFVALPSLDAAGAPTGRARAEMLPAVDLAVAVHRGSDDTMAQTYGALGAHVVRHELGIDGPIRETYLPDPLVTEVGWPIFRTGG